LVEKLLVVEQVLHEIRVKKETTKMQLAEAVAMALPDYLENEELTAMTALDHEDFYETEFIPSFQ
jgi:hypothetical protein